MTTTRPHRWTWDRNFGAHYGGHVVTVPDQVADDQRGSADRDQSFPMRLPTGYPYNGRIVRARIDAEATGIGTGGTGDLVVERA